MSETPETTTGDYLADPSHLALRTGLPSDDAALLLELQRATDRFRAECGHHVTRTTETVHLSGNGNHGVTLPGKPVVGTPTVTVDGTALTAPADFAVGRAAGILRRHNAVWPDGLDNIEVTYTYGHATIPPDVADAVLEAAELGISMSEAGVEMVVTGGEQVKFANSLANGGVTERWAAAVARHQTGGGDRS